MTQEPRASHSEQGNEGCDKDKVHGTTCLATTWIWPWRAWTGKIILIKTIIIITTMLIVTTG